MFFQQIAFENVVCWMMTILFRPWRVKFIHIMHFWHKLCEIITAWQNHKGMMNCVTRFFRAWKTNRTEEHWKTGHKVCYKCTNVMTLVAISGTAKLVPYHVVKSHQLSWRSGTRRWNLRVPDLQMSCSDLTRMRGYQPVLPAMVTGDILHWPFGHLNEYVMSFI